MPQTLSKPPKTLSWPKATPLLVVSAIFDVFRYAFLFFWLFGPVLFAAVCTAYTTGTVSSLTFGFLGTKTAAAVCAAGAGVAGFVGFAPLVVFGTVMSIAVAILGFMVALTWLLLTDARVFRENPFNLLWSFEGLAGSLFVMVFFLYRAQIRREKKALKIWRAKNAADTASMRAQQQQALFAQMREKAANDAVQQAEAEQAAEEEEAAKEIPESEQRAA